MFNTLKDYINWRNDKRAEYKQLSAEIRALKLLIRNTMRLSVHSTGDMQNQLIDMKFTAFTIMEERRTAKDAARASWETWRAQFLSAA